MGQTSKRTKQVSGKICHVTYLVLRRELLTLHPQCSHLLLYVLQFLQQFIVIIIIICMTEGSWYTGKP